MKNSIEKLINEYAMKIQMCDKVIHGLEETKRIARREKFIEDSKRIRGELQVVYAQRQSYVQAKVDIDSLLDNLEETHAN